MHCTACPKKNQHISRDIFYKRRTIFVKFRIHDFLNKFAAKTCKRFPPHLNNVSTLPCETKKMLIAYSM